MSGKGGKGGGSYRWVPDTPAKTKPYTKEWRGGRTKGYGYGKGGLAQPAPYKKQSRVRFNTPAASMPHPPARRSRAAAPAKTAPTLKRKRTEEPVGVHHNYNT